MREQHVQATQEQMSHEHFASTNRANFASVNGGRPAMAAVSHPMTNANMVTHTAYNNNLAGRHITATMAIIRLTATQTTRIRRRSNPISSEPKYNDRRLIRMSANHIMNPIPTTGAGNTNGGRLIRPNKRPAALLRAVCLLGLDRVSRGSAMLCANVARRRAHLVSTQSVSHRCAGWTGYAHSPKAFCLPGVA